MTPNHENLRIAMLITGEPHLGGAQTHVRDLSTGLSCRGHECTVLSGPPDGLFQEQLRDNGVSVVVLPSFGKPLSPLRDPLAFGEILLELRRMRPDIVAAHTAKAGFLGRIAARCLHIPCVFTPHGLSIVDRKTGRTQTFFLALERLAGHCGGKMITVCKAEKQLAAASRILPIEDLAVVHNGIPDDNRISDPGRQPPVVTMVARFESQKDHATLLRALAQLTSMPWRLRLAGSGLLLPAVERLAVELGIRHRIDFLGEQADIPELLSTSQVFVLTSHWEAFPISVLEAMRAGLPVVATDIGGMAEAVEYGRTGYLVPPSDHRALKKRLGDLLEYPALRVVQGNAGRRRFIREFGVESMVTATLAVYRKALAGARGAGQLQPADNPAMQSTAVL